MQFVNRHLGFAKRVRISNVWFVVDGYGRRFLIDTGHIASRPMLRYHLWKAGVRGPGDLTAVLLTHRHSDHAGNARWLRRTYGCRVACHESDMMILAGHKPAPKLAGRDFPLPHDLLCRYEDRFPAQCLVDDVFTEGAWRWGFHTYHVGGHTEGSTLLYHEPARTLFTGDAVITGIPPLRAIETLQLAVPAYSLDAAACHRNVRAVVERLPPVEILCGGHGPAVTQEAHAKLRRVAGL